jgi:hypothetical protein
MDAQTLTIPESAEPADDWCTIAEAARRLHVTPTAIRNRVKRGTLPTRPNGNFGKLVNVPPTVTLTPDEPVTDTVTGTVDERVPITVMLTVMAAHIETLKDALAKAEAAAERGRLAEIEAATVPVLHETIAALKTALAASQSRNADLRYTCEQWQAEVERMTAPAGAPLHRVWRWIRAIANSS